MPGYFTAVLLDCGAASGYKNQSRLTTYTHLAQFGCLWKDYTFIYYILPGTFGKVFRVRFQPDLDLKIAAETCMVFMDLYWVESFACCLNITFNEML